ncbi:sulfotransferase [Botrimarina colliarenosi]|nr:sulfotransferase [Botrimarina colliarenosi]
MGKGRSGTTWLSEIINYRRDHRYLFEPFTHSRRFSETPLCRGFGDNRGYTRPESSDADRYDVASAILGGRSKDSVPDAYNRGLLYNRRIIKDISCLLYLPWLLRWFPEHKWVLLVRNPLATAASQAKYQWRYASSADYQDDHELVADHLHPFMPLIAEIDAAPSFDRAVLSWAIAYRVLVDSGVLTNPRCHVVHYEELLTDTGVLDELFRFLGRDDVERARPHLSRQSKTTWRSQPGDASRTLDGGATPDQHLAAERILQAFGFGRAYDHDGKPVQEAWRALAAAGKSRRPDSVV